MLLTLAVADVDEMDLQFSVGLVEDSGRQQKQDEEGVDDFHGFGLSVMFFKPSAWIWVDLLLNSDGVSI
jgi:hypothetical protein